jgi:uncharacterized protein (DUF2236 family)
MRRDLTRIAGDSRSLLPGPSAGILQLLHPAIGAAVWEHSDFVRDPFGRVYRSVPQIWATLLAPDRDQRAKGIRDLHKGIKGVDDAGRRYHALDPDVFWWAHATFTWEMFRAVQLFFPWDLDEAGKDDLYAETVEWYEAYGVSTRPVPATYAAFVQRFDEICATELELTPAARHTIDIGAAGAVDLPGGPIGLDRIARPLVAPVARAVLFGALPSMVRKRFDLPYSTADRLRFRTLAAGLRATSPLVPTSIDRALLTWRLRALGNRTRDERYVPA